MTKPGLDKPTAIERRRVQWTLKWLLALVGALCLLVGAVANSVHGAKQRWRDEQAALRVLPRPEHGPVHEERIPLVLEPFFPRPRPAWSRRVVRFDIGYLDVTDDECLALKDLGELRYLDVSGNLVTDRLLLSLQGLGKLEVLHLRSTRWTDEKIAALRPFKRLKELDLGDNQITDRGVAEVGAMPSLERLFLARTMITDAGIQRLTALGKWIALDFANTHSTDNAFVNIGECAALRCIYLDYTQITDATISYFVACSQLEVLSLRGTGVTDRGILRLRALKKLTSMTVPYRISNAARSELTRACPGIWITD